MVNHAVSSRINMERMKQVYEQIPKYRRQSLAYDKYNKRNLLNPPKVQSVSQHMNVSPTTILNNTGDYICRTINTAQQNSHILTYQSSSSQYLHQQQQIPIQKAKQNYFNIAEELISYDENKKNIKIIEENQNSHYNKIIHHRNIQYNQATSNDYHHSGYSRKPEIYDENNETFSDFKIESNEKSYENNCIYGNHYSQTNYGLIENRIQERSLMMDTGVADDCKINLCMNMNCNLDDNTG